MAITPRTATVVESGSAASIVPDMSTAQVGDYVVLTACAESTINTPSGWTPLFTQINQVVDFAAFGRFLDGTSADNPTLTKTDTGASNRFSAIVEPFAGVDTTTPLDVAAVINQGASGSSIALTGLTTVTDGALVISGVAIDASAATYAFSLSWTGGTEVKQTTGTGRRHEVAQKPMATAGASGTATWSQTGGALYTVGFQLALRPAIPVIRSVTEATFASSSGTCAKPAGLIADDYLLAWHMGDADNATLTAAGFDLLASQAPDQSTNIPAAKLWGKLATSTDAAASTFTFGQTAVASASISAAVTMMAIQKGTFDPDNPVSVIGNWTTSPRGAAGSGVAQQSIASISGEAQGLYLGLLAADANGNSQTYPATSSSMTLVDYVQSTGGYSLQAVYKQVLSSTGATGTKTVTPSGTNTSNGWSTLGVMIKPGGGSAGTGGGGTSGPLDITYVGSGAWAAGAASPAALNPTGLADGDKLFAVVHSRESTTSLPATVGVWTKAHEQAIGSGNVGAGTGPTRFTIYEADATASMSGAAAGLTSLGTTASLVRVHAFRAPAGATGLTWSRAFASYSHASSTNIGGTTSSSIELAAKDMLLVAHGSPDDTTTSLPLTSVSATGLTFGTITGGAVLASGTGNDHAAASYVVPVTAGSGTSTVTLAGTANAAETGGSIVLRIRLSGTVAGAPTVAAGADAAVYVNQTFTRLPTYQNTPTSYNWTIQSGPTGVGTSIGTAAQLDWAPTVAGTYVIRITATNTGGSGYDEVTLTVNSPTAPTVNAGVDTTATAGTAFTRTATESSNGSTITARSWTIVSGPFDVGASLGTAAALNWTPSVPGTFTIRYSATNGIGTTTDDAVITVGAASTTGDLPVLVTSYLTSIGATGTTTSPLFTPAVGEVILVKCFTDEANDLAVTGISGGGLTYELLDSDAASNYSEGLLYGAVVGAGQSAEMSVSVTWSGAGGRHGIITERYTGAQTTFSAARSSPKRGPTSNAAPSATITTTENNSLVSWFCQDWNVNAGTAAYRSGAVETQQYLHTNVNVYAAYQAAVTAGSQTIGMTAPLQKWVMLGVELCPLPGGVAAPTANAGADVASHVTGTQFTRAGGETGSGITERQWKIISGPTGAGTVLTTLNTLNWTPTTLGTYTLEYSNGNTGGVASDTMSITVITAVSPPVANAGADATVVVNTAFTRTGSGTNTPTSYTWTVVSGPANVGATIGTAAALNWTPTATGTYVLRLTATNAGGSGTDDLTLTVNPPAPVTDAGADATVVAGNAFTRTGSATNSPSSYAWTIVSGPAGVTPGTNIGNAAALSYTPTIVGTYVLRLTATNVTGSGTDDLTLTVNPPAPVANAGADANITLGQTFTRTGSGTNSPTGYAWTIVSGPAGVTAGTNIGNTAALSYQPTIVGTYVLRLTASNVTGSGTDDLTLTVSYDTPTANAGVDAGINLGSAFNRTATEDAKTAPVVSRAWTVFSGPAQVGNTLASAAALSWTPTTAGTYVLRYTFVTDGGTATDDVQVTVTLQPPTANAGVDASALVNQLFTRTGTDTGVNITARAWTITGGPTGVGSTLGTAAALSWTPTQPGAYTLRYTVTNAAGSAWDEMILTVNGPPVVDIGADISVDNRTPTSRVATETGGGGVTAREWKITAGPQLNTVIGNTSTLDWTPTLPGTYTITYTATNPYGTGTDSLVVTVAAIVIGLASSSASVSSIVNPTLARRARITVAGTSIGVSTLASVPLKRARKMAGTKSATSTFTVGKPRNVTRHSRTISANSPVITAALATRRTFKETVTRAATTTATGKLRLVTRSAVTATQSTPSVSSKLVTARQNAGSTAAVSSLAAATLRGVSSHIRTITAQSTASLAAEVATRLSRTISAQAIVRTANLGVQQQGAATASAASDATGSLVVVSRHARTLSAAASITRKLARVDPITETITAELLVSRKLNATIREAETVVQAGFDYTVQLGITVRLIYDGMIGRSDIYMSESAGILRQLSGQARAISQLPTTRLNRATRVTRTVSAGTTISAVFGRTLDLAGSTTAYSFVPGTALVRLRFFDETVLRAQSALSNLYNRRTSVFVRRAVAISSMSKKIGGAFRFKQIVVRARSRFQERSGYAALTTAKAVTTSPLNKSKYVRLMAGYVTAQVRIEGDLVVALPRLGYAEARATATGNLVRVDPLDETITVDARVTADEKGVGKLSTVIRIFENEELDAYINNENYTGSNLVAISGSRPTVFRRTFTRPRS